MQQRIHNLQLCLEGNTAEQADEDYLVVPLVISAKAGSAAIRETYDIIKREFLAEFRKEKKVHTVDILILIKELEQKDNESYQIYYERTVVLLRRVGGKDKEHQLPLADNFLRYIINKYAEGLLDSELAEAVLDNIPNTLAETYQLVEKKQRQQLRKKQLRTSKLIKENYSILEEAVRVIAIQLTATPALTERIARLLDLLAPPTSLVPR